MTYSADLRDTINRFLSHPDWNAFRISRSLDGKRYNVRLDGVTSHLIIDTVPEGMTAADGLLEILSNRLPAVDLGIESTVNQQKYEFDDILG